MQFYKHYSFDLWLTLIKSNLQFKTERTKIFHAQYNPLNKSFEEVATIFRQVDLMCNSMNEKTGKNIDAEEMYLMVISLINNFDPSFKDINPAQLYLDMEQLIFNYLPVVYSENTKDTLARLTASGQSTLSLLSNTGFIKGTTLRTILKELELDQYLDFQLYSDEHRLSKPNLKFFELMLSHIDRNKHTELELYEIVHVGDNPAADFDGARALGIHSVLINSNDQTITCLS